MGTEDVRGGRRRHSAVVEDVVENCSWHVASVRHARERREVAKKKQERKG